MDEGSNAAVKKFAATMKPAFTVVHDASAKSAESFGVGPIPANYVIGRDGKVVAVLGYDLPGLQKAAAQAVGGGVARAGR